MLFAKKKTVCLKLQLENGIVQYTGDREVFVAWPGKVVSVRKIILMAKK